MKFQIKPKRRICENKNRSHGSQITPEINSFVKTYIFILYLKIEQRYHPSKKWIHLFTFVGDNG